MMLYHSKKPTVHYLFPEDYHFPPGDFELFDTKSKKVLVDQKEVLPYKISNAKAMKLLTAELNTQVGDLIKGIQKVASKISESKNSDQNQKKHTETESSQKKPEKQKSSFEFLTLTTKVMTLFWKIAKTEDEESLKDLKKEMLSLKKTFQEKGYHPNEDFEEIPFKLREKYQKEGKLEPFKEAALEFEKLIHQFKK